MVFAGGKIVATPLLASEPVLEKGPPQRLTYRLNPRAVWSDGTPITSSDLRYTWEQGATGPNVGNPTGWEQIAAVDDSAPRAAVVTFAQPYAAWTNPFGALGFVLPKHLLDGKDRLNEMKDGVTWSGGPWKLDKWVKGQSVRFVPNTAYWVDKPHLDALVLKVIPDAGATFAAYKSGEVSLIQGVPPETSLGEVQALPDTAVDVTVNTGVNGLLFNTQKAPLDSVAVRQALAYATDRDVLVRQAFGLLKPDIKPIHALMTPVAGRGTWSRSPSTGATSPGSTSSCAAQGGPEGPTDLGEGRAASRDRAHRHGRQQERRAPGADPSEPVEGRRIRAQGQQRGEHQRRPAPGELPRRLLRRPLPQRRPQPVRPHVLPQHPHRGQQPQRGQPRPGRRCRPRRGVGPGQQRGRRGQAAGGAEGRLPDHQRPPSHPSHRTRPLRARPQRVEPAGVRNDSGPNGPWLRTVDWFCRGGTC